jgi:RhtB (resistance to homoserine/threonine) family protein
MMTQLLTIGLLVLLSAMLPGPDFAIVTKNTLTHSRRSGLFTSLGISSACLVHVSYCMLGLAIVISQSIWLFNIIKYIGAFYLIFLGITSLTTKDEQPQKSNGIPDQKTRLSDAKAFGQGFLCNLLNPKATLFFLSLFTIIIKPGTFGWWGLLIPIELFIIISLWFCSLTILLSHPPIVRLLGRIEKYIAKLLGVFLIGFGVALAFVKR